MRARGFGGVPLESRELMLASDFLRGGRGVGGLFGPANARMRARVLSPSLLGAATPGSRSSLTRPRTGAERGQRNLRTKPQCEAG